MKCVFFGSPDFAVASLDALLQSKHEILGVVTQPDRPAGRGLHLEPPAVKTRALAANLPIIQPEKVNCQETYDFLEKLKPEILVVVAYGGFLGEKLLKFCGRPPVNVHPSLLPDLRGAAPMQWAVLKGYTKTGVTTQHMVKAMDEGDILLQVESELPANATSKDMHEKLKLVGGELIVKTLDGLESGAINPRAQDHSKATHAPLLTKEQGLIQWDKNSAQEIHNQIRGLYPWPGAYSSVNKKRVKILKSLSPKNSGKKLSAGEMYLENDVLLVGCKEGTIEILELQPEGKRAMLPKEFVNGMKGLNLPSLQFDGV